MSTSANVIEYDILKDGKVVGYFRKHLLTKYPLYSDLLKYQPLADHEIYAHGYDEEEEDWEDEPENLDTFMKRAKPFDKKIKEYYNDKNK